MSNSATFEFITSVEINEIKTEVSARWYGAGYSADVYTYPEWQDRILCTLEYFFGVQKERFMLFQVLKYLKYISFDQKVYYYRCADFAPIYDLRIPVLEICAEDIFTDEFSPSMGASIETKYAISSGSIDKIAED